MKRSLAEDGAAATSRGRGRKRKKVDTCEEITRANAVNSPLLRLPAEIRVIILRMAVGDQDIHLFTTDDAETRIDHVTKGLKRAVWYRNPFRDEPGSTLSSDSSSTTTALENPSQTFITALAMGHVDLIGGKRLPNLAIFRASRQIYQDVFPLFWGTNRFFFKANILSVFLDNLNEIQRDNVKNLMVVYYVECSPALRRGDWERLYLDTQWALWQGDTAMDFPLPYLASLDIHLRLCGGDGAANSTRPQLKTIHTVMRAFEKVRSQILQDATLTVSYFHSYRGPEFDHKFTLQQVWELSTKFRKRLTGITEHDSSPVGTLVDNIRELEASNFDVGETLRAHIKNWKNTRKTIRSEKKKKSFATEL